MTPSHTHKMQKVPTDGAHACSPADPVKTTPPELDATDPLSLPLGWTPRGWIVVLRDRAARTEDRLMKGWLLEAARWTKDEWAGREDPRDSRDGRHVFRDGLHAVPSGWQPDIWSERLRVMADRCEDMHPTRADELRAAAESLNERD